MSWLTKQFRSFKKAVIPREIREPFTKLGKAIPNEITGAWDDVIKGSAQLGEAIGFSGLVDKAGYGPDASIPSVGDAPSPQIGQTEVMRARDRLRRGVYRAQGRASTVRTGSSAPYTGQPKSLLGS